MVAAVDEAADRDVPRAEVVVRVAAGEAAVRAENASVRRAARPHRTGRALRVSSKSVRNAGRK